MSHLTNRSLTAAGLGFTLLAIFAGWHLGSSQENRVEAAAPLAVKTKNAAAVVPTDKGPLLEPSHSAFDSAPPAVPPQVAPPAVAERRAPLKRTAPLAPPVMVQVDPNQPGHHLQVAGQFIAVEQYSTNPATGKPELGVAMYSFPEGAQAAPPASTAPQSPPSVSARGAKAALLEGGLSYEDELFRAKWGWSAYNAAHRAATWESQP